MDTIGENLKYERFEVVALDSSTLELKKSPSKTKQINICEIKKLELTGIKSASGFSGTMEWGMRNPTFILPTTIWNNIISLFKRKNDTFFYKVTLLNDIKIIIYCSNSILNQELKQIVDKK